MGEYFVFFISTEIKKNMRGGQQKYFKKSFNNIVNKTAMHAQSSGRVSLV